MMRIIRLSLCGAVGVFFAVASGGPVVTHAQESSPIPVVTWRAAGSYIPPAYIGKALPNGLSPITASVTVFNNGKVSDLSGNTIYWYMNDVLAGGGIGSQSFTFTPVADSGNSETVKVEIPDYPGGLILHSTQISVAAPASFIDAPFPAGVFSASPLTVAADSYFFPVSSADQLSYAWTVNGTAVSSAENPATLQVSLGSGTTAESRFDISLSVATADNSIAATDERTFTYQPLP